ncbi:hypothetical protein L208DRAFT_1390833, partial [Tricholoma matsutake]
LTITSSFPHAGGPLTSSVKSFKSIHLALLSTVSSHVVLHTDDEALVLKRFLHGMGYYAPDISGTNEKLEAAMRNVMLERKIKCPQLEKTLHLAANLIEVRSLPAYNQFPEVELHSPRSWHFTNAHSKRRNLSHCITGMLITSGEYCES